MPLTATVADVKSHAEANRGTMKTDRGQALPLTTTIILCLSAQNGLPAEVNPCHIGCVYLEEPGFERAWGRRSNGIVPWQETGVCVMTKLFYWLFESRQAPDKSPLVIFFQGGPGASSMYSVTSGNGGPCILNDAGTDTTINKYSFNSFANVMYIDQPALVGFSEGTPPTNSIDAAKSTLVALEKFFSENPKYNTEVFLVGQSYAGHYIPAMAQEMYAQKSKINLKGVAIGNGLVIPIHATDGLR
ncbi:hypothetical protein FOZ61_002777 [Perkinsus olseni]|uniref:Carboxypeptidase n=1 Tax=Perkinsus olseni TaxID=32597 RepID=A0A7J6MEJ0_PEROL|nr:hypothetical protein FOZ61_002777 [Perkinsus olseni]KAF4675073.1 hypothetical protein FOL46_002989 [Perkinsus olseni]